MNCRCGGGGGDDRINAFIVNGIPRYFSPLFKEPLIGYEQYEQGGTDIGQQKGRIKGMIGVQVLYQDASSTPNNRNEQNKDQTEGVGRNAHC
jgi:hypothetical protein